MIGKLTGRVGYRTADHVMIEVQGVGYVVYCSDRTLAALPGPGQVAALYTDLLVREDLLQLYGFLTLAEKEWHRLLMSVQGVGARASLAILGALGPDGVSRAIAMGDWNSVKAAKGIGPKIAQRVVLDLKDKAPQVMAMGQGAAEALGEVRTEVVDIGDAIPAPVAAAQPSGNAAQADGLRPVGRGICGGSGGGGRAVSGHARIDPRGLEAVGAECVGKAEAHERR